MKRQSNSRKSRRIVLGTYVVFAVVVMAAITWVGVLVRELERKDIEARVAAEHHEALILALWRMDSWFAPFLVQEGDRPYAHYFPFYSHKEAYSRSFELISLGDSLLPSPLLRMQSPFFEMHVQVDSMGHVDSPQVPTGSFLDPSLAYLVSDTQVRRSRERLEELTPSLDFANLREQVLHAEGFVEEVWQQKRSFAEREARRESTGEWSWRAQGAFETTREDEERAEFCVGFEGFEGPDLKGIPERIEKRPFVPLWLSSEQGEPRLWFWRRVLVDSDEVLQGTITRWPELRQALLSRIQDQFPAADLIPYGTTSSDDAASEMTLATVGVQLKVDDPMAPSLGFLTVTQASLAVSWFAVLLGVVAVGWTLRSSLEIGERRYRFASVVTHELRTPLTTFKLYTDMLASDMIQDEAVKKQYLETLRCESVRLSHIVENVLAYSKLEEGHARPHLELLEVGELFDRLTPRLVERTESGRMSLSIDTHSCTELELRTDSEAVFQILFNLVDNACKYASPTGGLGKIQIEAVREGHRVIIRISDDGPGISGKALTTIFDPFERAHHGDQTIPGIGVGLTLARGLAEKLGGGLRAISSVESGACFELTLPVPG